MLSRSCYAILYSSIPLLVAASSPFPPDSERACYLIDGSPDVDAGPCYGNVDASMCCFQNEECDKTSTLCFSTWNGLVGQYDNGSSIWRRSCTDFTWQDPECLAIAYYVANESVQLSACEDGTFCPRNERDLNTTCCENHLGQWAMQGQAHIPESEVSSIRATRNATSSFALPTGSSESSIDPAITFQTAASISPSKPTSPSLATPISISASTPAPTSSSTSSGGLSQSTKIGLAIGISFGSLLIVLLSYITFRLYEASIPGPKKREREMKGSGEPIQPPGIQQRHEMSAARKPQEMYTFHNTHEVEARAGPSELWDSRSNR